MENEQDDSGRGLSNPSRETKFSGANGDREMFIFLIQPLATVPLLIHALLTVVRTIHCIKYASASLFNFLFP